MAMQKSEDQVPTPSEAPEKDSPLLDLSDAGVKRFIKTAKARGYVNYDELNAVLPSEEVSSEQIEDTMSMLSDMGITVVESEDQEEAGTPADAEDAAGHVAFAEHLLAGLELVGVRDEGAGEFDRRRRVDLSDALHQHAGRLRCEERHQFRRRLP